MLPGNNYVKQVRNAAVLYSAWFCPFAQRAWMALNELEVPYELVESLTIDPQTEAYIKHPKLLSYNPNGLVPVLVFPNQHNEEDEEDVLFSDSIPILKELYGRRFQNEEHLLDQCFQEANHWNKRICSPFYPVLMRQDPKESEEVWNEMTGNLLAFCQHLSLSDNPVLFYDGKETPGIVDLTVFPFVHRLYIVEHYKGFSLPETTEPQQEAKKKLIAWKKNMEARPAVAKTLATREALIPVYLRYADGTAKSKVAESVRKGQAAHDV